MAGGKGIHIFIPKYFCISGGSLYGLVARKLKRWNEPFIHSVRTRTFCRGSCTAAERFVFGRNCFDARKIKHWNEPFIQLS